MACSLAPGSRTDQRAGQPSPHRSPPRAGLWRCRGEGTPPWPGPGTVGLVSLGIQEAPVGRTAWEGELCPRGDRCSQGALGSSARRLLGRGSMGPHDSGETLPLPLVGTLHGRQGQPVLWRGLRWGGTATGGPALGDDTSRLCLAAPGRYQAPLLWPWCFPARDADGPTQRCSPGRKKRVCLHSCGQKCVPQHVAAWEAWFYGWTHGPCPAFPDLR